MYLLLNYSTRVMGGENTQSSSGGWVLHMTSWDAGIPVLTFTGGHRHIDCKHCQGNTEY